MTKVSGEIVNEYQRLQEQARATRLCIGRAAHQAFDMLMHRPDISRRKNRLVTDSSFTVIPSPDNPTPIGDGKFFVKETTVEEFRLPRRGLWRGAQIQQVGVQLRRTNPNTVYGDSKITFGVSSDGSTSVNGSGEYATPYASVNGGPSQHSRLESLRDNYSRAMLGGLATVGVVASALENTHGVTIDTTELSELAVAWHNTRVTSNGGLWTNTEGWPFYPGLLLPDSPEFR